MKCDNVLHFYLITVNQNTSCWTFL